MRTKFKPKDANEQYELLASYSETRTREISGMSGPYIKITDRYGRLISRIVFLLGTTKPRNIQDIVIRDLIADVFDFLYESRPLILAGKLIVAFPIARRAYESLSLLHLCVLDKSWADKWHKGREISNGEIRRELAKHPMGESEKTMKEAYKFFCSATHPNRGLIPQRFLGQGNEFVLGVIAQPSLILIADYCMKSLGMWFWLTATATYFYREIITKHDKDYFEAYRHVASEAKRVNEWLAKNYNNLLVKEREADKT